MFIHAGQRVDGEMENYHRINIIYREKCLYIIPRLRIGLTIPNIATAIIHRDFSDGGRINKDMVCHYTVVTVEGVKRVCHHRIGSEHHAMPAVIALRHHRVLCGNCRKGNGLKHGIATIDHIGVGHPAEVTSIRVINIYPCI